MLIVRANDTILELYEEQSVSIRKRFAEIENISKPMGSFSLSFRLPATEVNVGFFGAFYDGNNSDFDAKKKVPASISIDTIPILSGNLQLKGTFTKADKFHEFEVVVFGEVVDLGREVGDTQLRDLDWSALEHQNNYANVVASWAGTLLSGDVRYGIVGRGQNLTGDYYTGNLTMFIRHKAIVDRIFEEAGYTLNSTFFDSAYFLNKYTPLLNGKKSNQPTTLIEDNIFSVGLGSDVTQNGTIFFTPTFVETSPFFDGENLFNPTGTIFTPPYIGDFRFAFYATYTKVLTDAISIGFQLRRVADDTLVYNIGSATGAGATEGTVYFDTGLIPIEEACYLVIGIGNMTSGQSVTLLAGSGLGVGDGTGWVLFQAGAPSLDFPISPATNFPDMTVAEYLTSLQKCFNLVFVPDNVNPKVINVEPFGDYIDGGDTVDWTNKLHIGKDKDDQLMPTTSIQKRTYEWKYKNEADYINKVYQDEGQGYGRYKIDDTENDFATGQLTIETGFGAYPCVLAPSTDARIHMATTDNNEPVKARLKMVDWGGLQNATFQLWDDVNDQYETEQMPYFGHYNVPNPTITDIDNNFGAESVVQHQIVANPIDNLYHRFWRRWVTELFSSDSRIREAYFNLDALDVYTFKYSDKIWIRDSYWRVLELDYEANDRALTKVKLIKILDPSVECEFVPVSIGTDGKIQFENAAEEVSDGSELCCNFYGYTWTNSGCYQVQTPGLGIAPPSLPPTQLGGTRAGITAAEGGEILLTYQGSLSTAQEVTDGGDRLLIPEGAQMAGRAKISISEFDKVDEEIDTHTLSVYDFVVWRNYGGTINATVNSIRDAGTPGTGASLTLTGSGSELIVTVGASGSSYTEPVFVVVKLDYVLARN